MLRIRIDKTARAGSVVVKRQCNLECVWCHSDYFDHSGFTAVSNEILVNAVGRIANVASAREVHVRLAGAGEPTTVGSDELADLISQLRTLPAVVSVKMTTNGVLLGGIAEQLKGAGLESVTISLNSLNREAYAQYAGRDRLPDVLMSVAIAHAVGLRPKINAIYSTYNADELEAYESLSCRFGNMRIKFFDLIPSTGRDQACYLPLTELEEYLATKVASCVEEHTPYLQRTYRLQSGAVFSVKIAGSVNECPNVRCSHRNACLEGCRHSVRVGLDGVMQPCGVRKDNAVGLVNSSATDDDLWSALHSGGKVGYTSR